MIRKVLRVVQCDDKSCASANYTMVMNALGFPFALSDIVKITRGTLGQAQFWHWGLRGGMFRIKCISKNDYRAWAKGGSKEWAETAEPWVAGFFKDRSNDRLRDSTKKLRRIFKESRFDFEHRAPDFDSVRKLFDAGWTCELMLDPWLIYGEQPKDRLLHRIFVVNVSGDALWFHDPAADGEANRKASKKDVNLALSVDGAELVGYKRK